MALQAERAAAGLSVEELAGPVGRTGSHLVAGTARAAEYHDRAGSRTRAGVRQTDDDFQADDEAQIPAGRASLRTLHLTAGSLTPEAVVRFARPAGSPLHGAFHWGGDVADQAASMLQSWSDLLVT